MRPSSSLYKVVTLFTKHNCGLCDKAKQVLAAAQQQHPFEIDQIDIAKAENKKWFDLYAFDVPVVHIPQNNGAVVKQMHRLDQSQVIAALKNRD